MKLLFHYSVTRLHSNDCVLYSWKHANFCIHPSAFKICQGFFLHNKKIGGAVTWKCFEYLSKYPRTTFYFPLAKLRIVNDDAVTLTPPNVKSMFHICHQYKLHISSIYCSSISIGSICNIYVLITFTFHIQQYTEYMISICFRLSICLT